MITNIFRYFLSFSCVTSSLYTIRSTGLSGNLTSPTSEPLLAGGFSEPVPSTSVSSGPSTSEKGDCSVSFSSNPESCPVTKLEDMPKMGGSIVGLRTTKFSSANPGNSSNSSSSKLPEIKPRVTSLSPGISSVNPSTGIASKGAQVLSSGEENITPVSTSGIGLRPKPMPKPRPWSIVGVDRKSGEITSVSGGSSASPPSSKLSKEAVKGNPDSNINVQGGDKESIHSTNKFDKREPARRQGSVPGTNAGSSRGSVRDMINNMNKVQPSSNSTPASERKGSSLPRGVQPPSTQSTSTSSAHSSSSYSVVSDKARKFSNESQKGGSCSPGTNKKHSSDGVSNEKRESTCKDDPRILKLDDDFDVLEV